MPPFSIFPCSSLAASARDTAARKSYESVNWGAGQLQAYILPSKCHPRTRFGGTYTKIGTIQRRLAWPLRKDDTQIREAFHIFFSKLCSSHPQRDFQPITLEIIFLRPITAELHRLEVVRLCSLFRACLRESLAHAIATVASATSRPFFWWSNRLSRPRNEFRAGNRTHMGSSRSV